MNEEFLIRFLSSHNCTNELVCHLCFEDENISRDMLNVINSYLRQINNNINTVEIIFNKICSLFSLNDSLTNFRLETLFQLNTYHPDELPLFDYYNNIKYSEFVLDIIFNLASSMYQYNAIFEYFNNYKGKIQWIFSYFYDIKEQSIFNDSYRKVNSYHPDFIQIIEEGLIKRIGFDFYDNAAASANNNIQNNGNGFDDDDDDGFNLNI
jgi:hypothetical protein